LRPCQNGHQSGLQLHCPARLNKQTASASCRTSKLIRADRKSQIIGARKKASLNPTIGPEAHQKPVIRGVHLRRQKLDATVLNTLVKFVPIMVAAV
jgi:hypothetical protein